MTRSLFSFLFVLLTSLSASAQTTSSAPYCTPGYKNPAAATDRTNSVNVNSGSFTNSSGLYNNSTYVYYNNLGPIVMYKGSNNTIVVSGVQSTIGTTIAAWLDWNKDDSFDYFTELMDFSSINFSPSWSEMLSFVVPANADTGITRLRLISYGSDNATSIVACPSGGQTTMSPEHGETEDYRVRILASMGVEQVNSGQLTIYPNPVRDVLTVKWNSACFVHLYDITGREVMNAVPGVDGVIDVRSVPAGSYFVSLTENGVVVARSRVQVVR